MGDLVSTPRTTEGMPIRGALAYRSPGQNQWEKEVWEAINRIAASSISVTRATFSLTFDDVPLGSNEVQIASAPGAQVGDFVLLQPSMFSGGLAFFGMVVVANQISVTAQNSSTDTISTGAINFNALFIR